MKNKGLYLKTPYCLKQNWGNNSRKYFNILLKHEF